MSATWKFDGYDCLQCSQGDRYFVSDYPHVVCTDELGMGDHLGYPMGSMVFNRGKTGEEPPQEIKRLFKLW